MANPEHLRIIRQGAKVWNQWKLDNSIMRPDLSEAYLSDLILDGAYLSNTNFYRANLFKANLIGADLFAANLSGANLSEANLSEAILTEANLHSAKLNRAILRDAQIVLASLCYTNLSEADLTGANLFGADLMEANISKANLKDARFLATRLIEANLNGATLSQTWLWETQRSKWSIKGIICESVYWDRDAKEKTFYQPGDFERLFSEQNKIKLFYKDGANLLEIATLPSIIKNLEEKHPGCKLSFQSIEETSGGAIATLVLEESKDIAVEEIEAVRATIQADAERDVQSLRYALESKEIDNARLQGEVQALDRTIKTMLSNLQPVIYNISSPVGAAGHNAHTQDSNLNQIVNAENSSVETQIQGVGNTAISDVSDSSIIIGDENSSENK